MTVPAGITALLAYAKLLKGDEKGEAQVFLDRLFQAFGWAGYKEAGATLEGRVHGETVLKKKSTRFADLLWPGRAIVEMKKRGERLEKHYDQAFYYWQRTVPNRPPYVVLCNFDEFWIYDFNQQLDDPVDKIPLADFPERYTAFNFLLPEQKKSQFGNDRVAVTRDAADRMATLFNHLVARGVDRSKAQRFILQCVLCLFAEDIDLLPRGFFSELIDDCISGESSFDLFGDLFRWMNSPRPPGGGRFKAVGYFNGGLFSVVDPVDLTKDELFLLAGASKENWAKVQPPIFGSLFQNSMDAKERHALGAHFTREADIQSIVKPTVIRPWQEQIDSAKTLEALLDIRRKLAEFRVLDPACGSGNFLYVAYRDLVRTELALVKRLYEEFPTTRGARKTSASQKGAVASDSFISVKQFHGIDVLPFAVELAKVTLLIGKKLAYDEIAQSLDMDQLGLSFEKPLPLDNLDQHIVKDDALFCEWPRADAIIGNPPYQSKNKMQQEFGSAYVRQVRAKFSDVPGRADYCVYWFRRAHDNLQAGGRAGLVGTNTIRQNYSREGGLDYIVANGGAITEAVSTQVWPGEAIVHVSLVNWIKGKASGKKLLMWQLGDDVDSPWDKASLDEINPALSPKLDVTKAKSLRTNVRSEACYQGQTHGHEGFLLTPDDARAMIKRSARNREVLFPFLNGADLVGRDDGGPSRWVIDFQPRDMHSAAGYSEPFEHVKATVLVARQRAAEEEEKRNAEILRTSPSARVNIHHKNFLNQWWQLSWARPDLTAKLATLSRYTACARVTKRSIFEFISSAVRPSDALQVFPLADDYSFGLLQSTIHWQWFVARCSTLKRDFRYTSDTVFDSFPWPQEPTLVQVRRVAKAAVALRMLRGKVMRANGMSRRDLYRQLEQPGKSEVRDVQEALDAAVRDAYEFKAKGDPLPEILELNLHLAGQESKGVRIIGPGLPPCVKDPTPFVTIDCIPAPRL
jgi:hypothetical protein